MASRIAGKIPSVLGCLGVLSGKRGGVFECFRKALCVCMSESVWQKKRVECSQYQAQVQLDKRMKQIKARREKRREKKRRQKMHDRSLAVN